MRKKTTKEERQEIVQYCLEHGKDYKETAARYEISYSQIYQWVRHYEENGEAGLEDRRGKRKSDEEVDEQDGDEHRKDRPLRLEVRHAISHVADGGPQREALRRRVMLVLDHRLGDAGDDIA